MRTFKLLIITPDQAIFDGEAQYCGITTDTGSIGFEAMHEPMIAVLRNNTEIHLRDTAGSSKLIPVTEGILSFRDNTCTITASV